MLHIIEPSASYWKQKSINLTGEKESVLIDDVTFDAKVNNDILLYNVKLIAKSPRQEHAILVIYQWYQIVR